MLTTPAKTESRSPTAQPVKGKAKAPLAPGAAPSPGAALLTHDRDESSTARRRRPILSFSRRSATSTRARSTPTYGPRLAWTRRAGPSSCPMPAASRPERGNDRRVTSLPCPRPGHAR